MFRGKDLVSPWQSMYAFVVVLSVRTRTVVFLRLRKERSVKSMASSSRQSSDCVASSLVQKPWTIAPWKTSLQPRLLALTWMLCCGRWFIRDCPFYFGRLSSHQWSSSLHVWGRVMTLVHVLDKRTLRCWSGVEFNIDMVIVLCAQIKVVRDSPSVIKLHLLLLDKVNIFPSSVLRVTVIILDCVQYKIAWVSLFASASSMQGGRGCVVPQGPCIMHLLKASNPKENRTLPGDSAEISRSYSAASRGLSAETMTKSAWRSGNPCFWNSTLCTRAMTFQCTWFLVKPFIKALRFMLRTRTRRPDQFTAAWFDNSSLSSIMKLFPNVYAKMQVFSSNLPYLRSRSAFTTSPSVHSEISAAAKRRLRACIATNDKFAPRGLG